VIIVGAGQVGSNIAASLDDEHDVVVVDTDPDRVESVTYSHDVLAIQGDGTAIGTLEEAGIEEAGLVIASTDIDETNIVICGAAKAVAEPFTIARVTKTNLLRTWEQSMGAFGVDFMVCTDLQTAETIVRIAGLPGAHDVETFADGLVQMAEFEVGPDSPIAGETVSEADRFESLTFAALLRDDNIIVPHGETVIEAGDAAVVIGSVENVREFAGTLTPEPGLEDAEEIVIVGGTEIGYQTARLFEAEGLEPRLVERDPERARELAEKLPRTLVLQSDATDIDFLVREHVDESDIVVAAVEGDEMSDSSSEPSASSRPASTSTSSRPSGSTSESTRDSSPPRKSPASPASDRPRTSPCSSPTAPRSSRSRSVPRACSPARGSVTRWPTSPTGSSSGRSPATGS